MPSLQAYGMSVLPLELIKGYRSIKVCMTAMSTFLYNMGNVVCEIDS
jgi:hypothetical protein